MVEVVLRQRPDPIGPEKLIFVKQVAEDALQLLLVENREETPALVADEAFVCRSNVSQQFRVPLAEKVDHLLQSRKAQSRVRLEDRRRAEREQADHRSHL